MAEGKIEREVGQNETQKSSNLCCYSQRVCSLEKLKGFDFCHKHILEDKASPFKPCDFLAKSNGKRCTNPAPKLPDKEKSYCIIHTRKAVLRRAVEKRRKRRQRKQRQEGEGDYGEDYNRAPAKRWRHLSSAKSTDEPQSQDDDDDEEEDDDGATEKNSSDEDVAGGMEGSLKVDSAWHGDVDSDAESVDSDDGDILRHAGVWTVDEAIRSCCDKMVQLKTLYVGQYTRLIHVLQEKRRKYYQLIQAEEDEETGECLLSPTEILGPLRTRRKHGTEALLHKQAKEKRQGFSVRHHNPTANQCTHSVVGIRCCEKVLPMTKFCMKHIIHDPQQLLFQGCSFLSGDGEPCSHNVPKIYPHTMCRLHVTLPEQPIRTNVEKDLQDAKDRDWLRIEKQKADREAKPLSDLPGTDAIITSPQIKDKEIPIPKALQEKSSALLPPPQPKLEGTPPPLPSQQPDHLPDQQSSDAGEKESTCSTQEASLSGIQSFQPAPKDVLSPASVEFSPGIQNISPTLLEASLVAVCSGSSVIPSVISTKNGENVTTSVTSVSASSTSVSEATKDNPPVCSSTVSQAATKASETKSPMNTNGSNTVLDAISPMDTSDSNTRSSAGPTPGCNTAAVDTTALDRFPTALNTNQPSKNSSDVTNPDFLENNTSRQQNV
ncbi:KAT8 regulatory NSL complex subunit 2 [Nematostella vectensis]|uniref:KAT8 regulatory NSL complex subunit 2 n=1 Tax=Nematostella vectensis TaxID=45351 RepID=UPI001390247E|nr:KAT8 regulatory NSL complex subunit 2 [Nematostella vectensis]